jgi:carboxypeptidase Taq
VDDALKQLKTLLQEISDLEAAAALLSWDSQTLMPKGAANDRGEQLGTISRIIHIKSTSDEIGSLLETLRPTENQLDKDTDDHCLLRVSRRNFEKYSKVPADWVGEFARVTTIAQTIWEKARKEKNFSMFQPYLEHIVTLRKEYAAFFKPFNHAYDPLLDDFEPGLLTEDVKAIFTALRPRQVELLKEIGSKPQVDNGFLYQPYPQNGQWDFGVKVATDFGYDWNHGRQDLSAHPFTSNIGNTDVRITTRFDQNYLGSALFSTMHESGHGLYELGIAPQLHRSPLAVGASLALHESQSRMYENLVGRSLPFWKYYYPRLQEAFPAQLGNVDLLRFYKGINQVKPSLIRVEADEATYNLHIMLRMELEIALIEGNLAVKDLPQAWNEKMNEYLGLTPPDDGMGVLQDVHWSGGMLGYFSTYALGNLVAAQIWEKGNRDIPGLTGQFEKGEFHPLLDWLRQNIHRHGAKYEPQDLIMKVTGSKIDPNPYIRYLTTKYSEIYGL